ncbi:hypothetical protein C0J52_22080 [Blattella germanica]|nr:hypothetical protein C0J52_22080 [Blattella germanica]
MINDGSTRRIDMIAFQDTNKGWIIDPTIRMESHADQPIEVHNEKCSIYNATISYYKNKYQLKDIVVLGLMVGARGTITSQFVQFCRQFNLDKNFIKEIAVLIMKFLHFVIVFYVDRDRFRPFLRWFRFVAMFTSNQLLELLAQIIRAFQERFNKAPPRRATLLDWERRAFGFGRVKDRPRADWKEETCAGVAASIEQSPSSRHVNVLRNSRSSKAGISRDDSVIEYE